MICCYYLKCSFHSYFECTDTDTMKHCSGKYFYCSDKEARCLSDFDSCAKTKMKEVVQIVDNSVEGVPKYYSADLCAFKLRFQQVDTAQVLDQGWVH